MVKDIVFEYMHLCCLGVTKKLTLAWLHGAYTKNTKLSRIQIEIISNRLKVLSKYCPREFARRVESRLFTVTNLKPPSGAKLCYMLE